MDRRGFLRGTIAAVSSYGIVVTASDADILALARDGSLKVDNPVSVGVPDLLVPLVGEVLFNAKGQPVAVVSSSRVEVESIDATDIGGQFTKYLPGRATLHIEAVGAGPMYGAVHV